MPDRRAVPVGNWNLMPQSKTEMMIGPGNPVDASNREEEIAELLRVANMERVKRVEEGSLLRTLLEGRTRQQGLDRFPIAPTPLSPNVMPDVYGRAARPNF